MASARTGPVSPPAGLPPGLAVPVLAHLPQRQKMIIVGAALLAIFVSSVNSTLVSTAMPRIVSDLGGFDRYTWVFTSYMLTSTVSAPVFGKLSDRWGRKVFLMGGMVTFIITSAIAGSSNSMNQLIAFRGLQGLGAGMVMACGFTLVGDLFAPAERGKYQGVFAGAFALASIVGPLTGGFLTDHLSWRWAFYANIPIALMALPVLAKVLPTVRQPARGRIDLAGAAALSAAVVPLLLGFEWAGIDYAWDSPRIVGLFTAAGVMTLVFALVEWRAADPIIPLALFRNSTYVLTGTISVLSGFAMFGSIIYVPLFVQAVVGVSASNSGTITAPMMLGVVVASSAAGNIVARKGSYKVLMVGGMAVMALGLFLLSTMDANATRTQATLFMVVTGLGIGATMPILSVVAQNALPMRYLGVVTSNLQFYRQIGATIGVAVMGTVMSNRLHANLPAPHPRLAALPPEVTGRLEDPQALVNPTIRAGLATAVGRLPAGDAILASSLEGLRLALVEALQTTFLIGAVTAAFGILVALLLKQVPLRRLDLAALAQAALNAQAAAASAPAASAPSTPAPVSAPAVTPATPPAAATTPAALAGVNRGVSPPLPLNGQHSANGYSNGHTPAPALPVPPVPAPVADAPGSRASEWEPDWPV